MEYTSEIEIDAPLNIVVKYYGDIKYLGNWQPNLKAIEMLRGEPNEENSQVQLKFNTNGRTVDVRETLIKSNLPEEFTKTYFMKGVHQTLTSRFESISENKTKWVTQNKFEFSGFYAAMASVMMESLKKEGAKNLNLFKQFAERMHSENTAV